MGYKLTGIYIGQDKVRPAGWQPGANTIAYYEFDNNLNDSSGNNLNLTLTKGSVIYGTESGGGKYAYFNTSTATDNINLGTYDYGTFTSTVCFWWQPKQIYSGGYRAVFDWCHPGDPYWIRCMESMEVRGGISLSAAVNTWYHIVIIRTPTDVIQYVNGQLLGSNTWSNGSTSYQTNFRINAVENNNSLNNNNYIGRFIIESGEWSAQDILNDYNLTKSNYGIS